MNSFGLSPRLAEPAPVAPSPRGSGGLRSYGQVGVVVLRHGHGLELTSSPRENRKPGRAVPLRGHAGLASDRISRIAIVVGIRPLGPLRSGRRPGLRSCFASDDLVDLRAQLSGGLGLYLPFPPPREADNYRRPRASLRGGGASSRLLLHSVVLRA